ncbi:MAG: 50S ribosomal protein L9 [Syntrophaceae bacterium]|jgi:large subunit ribosomal protein L9|nr:50S ribosomal protein L9 [Syntrophaceae bacterium]HOC60033.1 50S ribosomal protein L9 [Smithellaceae bacterium]HQM46680.1 50S ribosomal protein L9 [Smithellaceae bacterium]
MKVILKHNVPSLGKAGDLVKVNDGYARNLLFPKGLAVAADDKNLKAFELERKNILQKAQKEKSVAQDLAARLAQTTLTLTRKVGDQHKIFGSVTSKDIEIALKEKGFQIDRKMIVHDEQIKSLGEFKVKIKLVPGVDAELKLMVVGEGS